MFRYCLCIIVGILCLSAVSATAEENSFKLSENWGQKLQNNMAAAWNAENYDLYLPINTWHNRLLYDKDKIDDYNEEPWGAGLGKSFYDSDGDWHALYAMGFKDSNKHLQTIFGYAYQHNWPLDCYQKWRVGIGYTLSLTQRSEYAYIPLPLPLPLAGIGYKNFNIQAAYVPGVKNDGNVLFTWLRWELNNDY